jgi:hypothetical protein
MRCPRHRVTASLPLPALTQPRHFPCAGRISHSGFHRCCLRSLVKGNFGDFLCDPASGLSYRWAQKQLIIRSPGECGKGCGPRARQRLLALPACGRPLTSFVSLTCPSPAHSFLSTRGGDSTKASAAPTLPRFHRFNSSMRATCLRNCRAPFLACECAAPACVVTLWLQCCPSEPCCLAQPILACPQRHRGCPRLLCLASVPPRYAWHAEKNFGECSSYPGIQGIVAPGRAAATLRNSGQVSRYGTCVHGCSLPGPMDRPKRLLIERAIDKKGP